MCLLHLWVGCRSTSTWFAGLKTILAIHSRTSLMGRALGDDQLKSAKGPLLQTIEMAVADVDRLLEPALGEG